MKIKLFIPLLVVFILVLVYLLWPPQVPISPLCTSSANAPEKCLQIQSNLGDTHAQSFTILGFAPYWNLKKLTSDSLSHITHFAYFALHLTSSGQLQTHVNRRELEPGYLNYTRLLNSNPSDKPLLLTFLPQDQSALTSILSSSSTRLAAIQTMLTALQQSRAQGVNIDFEPTGDTPPSLRADFTLFIQALHSQLVSNNYHLSISIYPSAGSRPRLWDLSALAPLTDHFVIMTYDYTMPLSPRAGPNSPLRDMGGSFEHNIVKNIAEISQVIDSRQILLGIPFYGYEWDTENDAKYAPTLSRGSVASFERIQQMLNDQTLSLLWDRNSLTAYGTSTSSGVTSQIYFDNEQSLRLKLDFVRSANLGGIAIWALGYDNSVPWLWPTINSLNDPVK